MSRLIRFLPLASVVAALVACSGAAPKKEPLADSATPVGAARQPLPHPEGFTVSDLRAFLASRARGLPEVESCDADYWAEKKLARSKEEFFVAFPHHVRADRERYHWCFYSRLFAFAEATETAAKQGPEAERGTERQQQLLERYLFVAHLARIFQADFSDPAYMRHAVHHFRELSRSVYFQRLKPSSETVQQLQLEEQPRE